MRKDKKWQKHVYVCVCVWERESQKKLTKDEKKVDIRESQRDTNRICQDMKKY